MIAETDSNHANENAKKNQIAARKRYTKSFSIDCRPTKKIRGDTDFTNATDPIEQALRTIKRVNCNNVVLIEKLQTDLNIRKNANWADEKKVLMERIATLEMDLRNEKKKFDDEKKTFTEIYMALGKAKDKEKEALEEEKMALVEKNAALEMELENEKKKCVDKKRALEEALKNWN